MLAAKEADLHPVTAYAVDVVDGKVVTGKPVLWAARRHLEDLERSFKRAGIWFDEASADRIIWFSQQFKLVEGEAAGEYFNPEPWQIFILGSIFGWMRDDGYRRFREAWIRVARGNFKSGLAAIVGLYCTGWDGSYGANGEWRPDQRAQVFSAASKLEQAAIVHKTAILMAEKSEFLKSRLRLPESKVDRIARVRIVHPDTNSFFQPLGRDSKAEDGWTPTCAIFDEVHAYGDRTMWDVFISAFVKRAQPLLFAITTAGYGGSARFGFQQDQFYRSVLDPKAGLHKDSAFVYIAEMDPEVRCAHCQGKGRHLGDGTGCKKCRGKGFTGDDWRAERNWYKANPNLGISVYLANLRENVSDAIQDRKKEPDVRVKNLNQWQQDGQRAISIEAWDASGAACPTPPDSELRNRPCFAGLDLASNRDLNALELYFPICGPWKTAVVLSFFWVAEETVSKRKKEGHDYNPWIDAGELLTTPGEFVDHEVIRSELNRLAKKFTIKKVGADRRFGDTLLPALEKDGFEVVRIAQSFANICPAWQTLEQLIGKQLLAHGGHAVLRWNAGNVVLKRDTDGLEMPNKAKSAERIDGIAALDDAIHLSLNTPYEGQPKPPVSHALSQRRGGGKRAILGAFK